MQLNLVVLGQRIDQICSRNRFPHTVFPATAFHQIVEEQSNDIVRLKKSSLFIHDAEAVGIAVSGDSHVRLSLAHLLFSIFEQMIVRFWRMPAEKHIAVIVNGIHRYASVAQERIRIVSSRAPEGIEYHAQTSFLDRLQIDDLAQARKVHPTWIQRFGSKELSWRWISVRGIGSNDLGFYFLCDIGKCRRAVRRRKFDSVAFRRIVRSREVYGPVSSL